jgi:3-methyladenine DNA glycosylase Tag
MEDSKILDFCVPGSKEPQLTEEQIDHIAEKAAEKAVEKLMDKGFKAVGKTVVEKLFWIVGVVSLGLYFWLQAKGIVK